MQRSSFFNAVISKEGVPDRSYLAEDFARYFSTFIGNGVFPNPSSQLQVIATDNNMNIRLKKGFAWINGYMYENTDDYILTVDNSDGVLDRIDRIVLRLDFLERVIKAVIKKGDWSSNAVPKDLQMDSDAYEIALADIKVPKGAISISQADITDLRLNKNLCGIVHGTVDQVDTTAIFNQFQSWYSTTKTNYDKDINKWTKEKKETFEKWYQENITIFTNQFKEWFKNTGIWERDFKDWLNKIKETLNGDIAGNLLNKINENSNKIDNLKTKVTTQYEDLTKAKHVSYTELKELIVNKQLKECANYLLTDYATKYQQPTSNVIKMAEVEPLLLTVSSENTLAPIAYSIKYPQDIIYYDFNDNKCEDGKTPRNGFIVNRIDTVDKNQAPGDFRGLLWIRYTPDETYYYLGEKDKEQKVEYEIWTSGKAKEGVLYKSGNKILIATNTETEPKNAEDSGVFDVVFDDITAEKCALFISDKTKIYKNISIKIGKIFERRTFGESCTSNNLGETKKLYNTVFGNNCSSNIFKNDCDSNSFGDTCYLNYFNNGCNSNIFNEACRYNELGNEFFLNFFGAGSCRNIFGNLSFDNNFGNTCTSNIFGNNCCHNDFGNGFYCNNCGNGFENNYFKNKCISNSFKNNCTSNTFGDSCFCNTFGNDCISNSFGDGCCENSFENGCYYNSFGNRCSRNKMIFIQNSKIADGLQYANIINLYDRDLRNFTDLCGKSYTITFDQSEDERYFYSYMKNASNNSITYTVIP